MLRGIGRVAGPTLLASFFGVLASCSSTTSTLNGQTQLTGPPASTHGGSAADVEITKCRQDPTDSTQVTASGTITNHQTVPADYAFTVEWYVGSMQATKTSYSQSGVPPNAPLGWTAQASLALPSQGPYSCRITRVIRTAESSASP